MQVSRQQGGAAAGKEGEGDAHHREDGQTHTHVLQGLGDDDRRHTHRNEHTVVVAGFPCDPEDPHDQSRHGDDHQKSPEKAELFADRGQNEVGVGGGQLL